MPKKKKPDGIDELVRMIESYAEASRADEMKGGGDPESIPVIEAELELARARLNAQISLIRRLSE